MDAVAGAAWQKGLARHRSAVAAGVAGMVVGQHAVAVCLTAPPEPWRQRWAGWYRIPDASGKIRAATIADGSTSRGRWVTAPASKPPAVVVARFDGSFLWRNRQALIH